MYIMNIVINLNVQTQTIETIDETINSIRNWKNKKNAKNANAKRDPHYQIKKDDTPRFTGILAGILS